ncbi:unnamed protein product [Spirodela intermedia]|uniref:Uncharacterized protein n=1 Tax=Spirodela intermedia TaxID=51605 RepID=A0A7I8IHM0_SPIIN|nr:unnamed protein product [Spirodela intermedia]CAA6656352.1 unnamed protein product [Spirodela intermedia]
MDALPALSSDLRRGTHPATNAGEALLFLPQPAVACSGAVPLSSSPSPTGGPPAEGPSGRSARRSLSAGPLSSFHRKAATGYAAALLDAARCGGTIAAMERDVRRFAWGVRALLADPLVAEELKGAAVRRAAEEGGFCRQLVTLVRMLVGKGKVSMVGKVMEEFERIHGELTGKRVSLVSSEEMMAVD